MALKLPHPLVHHDGQQDEPLNAAGVQQNFEALALAIPSGPRIVGGGALSIATSESTTSTSYTTLTTPDTVTVVLPTNGLLILGYSAIWQNTVASNARATAFIGATQWKLHNGTGASSAAETTGPAETNDDAALVTEGTGLVSVGGAGAATEVTTGQILGITSGGRGGVVWMYAAAGTYDISIKFKNNAAGTLTVKNRHLWVFALASS